MVIGLLTIIGLSHLSYKLIEMPVNNYRHKLGKSVDTSNLVTAQ
jgi:peptidoglycan/LPS O-acetylase OafA/YrhL